MPDQSNQVWSADFMSDALYEGPRFRVFNVIDHFNREAVAIEIDTSITGSRLIQVFEKVKAERVYPIRFGSTTAPSLSRLRSGCGLPKSVSKTIVITPGSPWENAYVESFIATFRLNCLQREWFLSVADANFVLQRWKDEDHQCRPHRSLGYRTPAEAAIINRGLTP